MSAPSFPSHSAEVVRQQQKPALWQLLQIFEHLRGLANLGIYFLFHVVRGYLDPVG